MSRKTLSSSKPRRPQTLYFAYGSNLSFQQMAVRCPESRYIGRALLPGFRWQINQRGFANIVAEPGSTVEGLCYLLSQRDEARLDKSEGVPTAYSKKQAEVEMFTASGALVGRKVTEIIAQGIVSRSVQGRSLGERGSLGKFHLQSGPRNAQCEKSKTGRKAEGEVVTALVYMSLAYVVDGPPRNEYVTRMNQAIADGTALGMSVQYVHGTMRPLIPEK
jgi:gamma-glutamylcyclotransferase